MTSVSRSALLASSLFVSWIHLSLCAVALSRVIYFRGLDEHGSSMVDESEHAVLSLQFFADCITGDSQVLSVCREQQVRECVGWVMPKV